MTVLKREAKNQQTLLHFTYLFSSGCNNENGKH